MNHTVAGLKNLEAAVPLFRELKRWQAVKHTLELSLRVTNASTETELIAHSCSDPVPREQASEDSALASCCVM